jgi:hypothetical protein
VDCCAFVVHIPRAAMTSRRARNGLTFVAWLLFSLALTSQGSASVALGSLESVSQALTHSVTAATETG